MFGLGKKRTVDRRAALRAAEEWRAKNKPKKAIAELRRILKVDPTDATAHAKLGPLLVMIGQTAQALPSLEVAAKDLEARGFADKAISLHLQRAQLEVSNVKAWEAVARLHLERKRGAEAVRVLIDGARAQRGRAGRLGAIRLLQNALDLAPNETEVLLPLARLRHKVGDREAAKELLQHAAAHAAGKALTRVRREQFRLFAGVGTLWEWLRS